MGGEEEWGYQHEERILNTSLRRYFKPLTRPRLKQSHKIFRHVSCILDNLTDYLQTRRWLQNVLFHNVESFIPCYRELQLQRFSFHVILSFVPCYSKFHSMLLRILFHVMTSFILCYRELLSMLQRVSFYFTGSYIACYGKFLSVLHRISLYVTASFIVCYSKFHSMLQQVSFYVTALFKSRNFTRTSIILCCSLQVNFVVFIFELFST